MSSLTDINPPPAARVRETGSAEPMSLAGPTTQRDPRGSVDVQPSARTDEMKYGASNPQIATENPTQQNGASYGNLRGGFDEYSGSGNAGCCCCDD